MNFLRSVLLLDAIASGATVLAFAALSGPLGAWLNVPSPLLFWVGVALVPWVAWLFLLSRRERVGAADVWAVIAGNALYALASVVLPFSGWIAPNALGVAVILAQAVAVGVFAELQYMGLRRRAALAVS